MEKIDIKLIKASKNYASALFETALSNDLADSILSDLNLISETIRENENLKKFLNNPVIKNEDKKLAVTEIFKDKVAEITINFLYLLSDNSRFNLIFEIQKSYKELLDDKNNIIKVKAVSAIPINDALREKLVTKIQSLLNKNVEIQYEIQPEIIGGLIIELNGKTIDNSVQTQLKKLKKQLI